MASAVDRDEVERRAGALYAACLAPPPKVVFCADDPGYRRIREAFRASGAWPLLALLPPMSAATVAIAWSRYRATDSMLDLVFCAVFSLFFWHGLRLCCSGFAARWRVLRAAGVPIASLPSASLLPPDFAPPCRLARPLVSALGSLDVTGSARARWVMGQRLGFCLEDLRAVCALGSISEGDLPDRIRPLVLRRLWSLAEAAPCALLMDGLVVVLACPAGPRIARLGMFPAPTVRFLVPPDPGPAPPAADLAPAERARVERALAGGEAAVRKLAREVVGLSRPSLRSGVGGWPRPSRPRDPAAREAALRALGLDRVVAALGLPPDHEDGCGRLYRIGAPDSAACFVRVEDRVLDGGGKPLVHWIGVPPHTATAREGVAWSFGLDEREYAPTAES